MSAIQTFLGVMKPLIKGDGTKVDAAELAGKYVLLYFSAHWCGPCRNFTPKFAEWYAAQRTAGRTDFEVVFVSADHDAASFATYFKTMPWLSIDYEGDEAAREGLNEKLKVSGIPSLAVMDKDGSTIVNDDAVQRLLQRPGDLPWAKVSFTKYMSGPLQTRLPTQPATWDALVAAHKHVAIYFSASWCGPCHRFTPILAKFYAAAATHHWLVAGSAPQVLFASRDRDQASFDEYYGHMPWVAIPFGDERIGHLADTFKLRGIPTLVVVESATGNIVTTDAVEDVSTDPAAAVAAWPFVPQPFPVMRPLEACKSVISALQSDVFVIFDPSKCHDAAHESAALAAFTAAAAVLTTKYGDARDASIAGAKVRCLSIADKVPQPLSEDAVKLCPSGHTVAKKPRTGAGCDCCRSRVDGEAWNCAECDFDRCDACYTSRAAPAPPSLALMSQIEQITSVGTSAAPGPTIVLGEGRRGSRITDAAVLASGDAIVAAVERFRSLNQ